MGRISPYQQQNLASSLVGTPGVDTGISSALNSQATALDSINTTMQTAKVEKMKAVKAQAALEKIQQDAMFEATLASEVLQFEVLAQTQGGDLKKNTPDTALQQMDNFQSKYAPTIAQKFSNPVYQAKATEALTKSYKSFRGAYMNEINTTQAKTAIAQLGQATEQWIITNANKSADQGYSPEQVAKGIKDKFEEVSPAYFAAFGEDAPTQLGKARGEAGFQYLQALAVKNPEALKSVIASKAFDDILEPSKMAFVYQNVERKAREQQAQIRMETREAKTTKRMEEILEVANITSAADLAKWKQDHPGASLEALTTASNRYNSAKKLEDNTTKVENKKQSSEVLKRQLDLATTELLTDPVFNAASSEGKSISKYKTFTPEDIESAHQKAIQLFVAGGSADSFEKTTKMLNKYENLMSKQKGVPVNPQAVLRAQERQQVDLQTLAALRKGYTDKSPYYYRATSLYWELMNNEGARREAKRGRPLTKPEYENLSGQVLIRVQSSASVQDSPRPPTSEAPKFKKKPSVYSYKAGQSGGAAGSGVGSGISKFLGK